MITTPACVYATLPGHRCDGPAQLVAGSCYCPSAAPPPPPTPDPALTLDGLRAAAGITANPYLETSTLNDDRAIASGKRRGSQAQIADARRRETERRAVELERRGVNLCRPQGPISDDDLDQVQAFADELDRRSNA